jgi:hypothetical protein
MREEQQAWHLSAFISAPCLHPLHHTVSVPMSVPMSLSHCLHLSNTIITTHTTLQVPHQDVSLSRSRRTDTKDGVRDRVS